MKGVIIAAGYGTRFLPVTKTIPKEMLPIGSIPAIDFIVKEFIEAGIHDIIIITSRRKKPLEDYFDREVELEVEFEKAGANEKLNKIKPHNAKFIFIRQTYMRGVGDALLKLRGIVNEPFIVAYPDDIVFAKRGLTLQLIDVYNDTKGCVIATSYHEGDVSMYGVLDIDKTGKNLSVKAIVEKPSKGSEPSKYTIVGRFILLPDILDIMYDEYASFNGKEFYHIGALNKLARDGKVFACEFEGRRFDIGSMDGYIMANLWYAINIENRSSISTFIKDIIQQQ